MSHAPEIKTVSLTLARRHFETLLDRAGGGQEFVITRHGKPIALLAPLTPEGRQPLSDPRIDPGASLSNPRP